MRPWLFTIGDSGVPSYWAFLMIGFTVAIYLAWREARRDGVDPNRLLDLSLLALLFGIIGARLMHILVEENPIKPGTPILYYYLDHPLDMFKLWNGLAFYGGLILAGAVGLIFAYRKRMGVLRVADIVGLVLPIGLFFGRIGCFMAGCCHGAPTDMPWGVTFDSPYSLARPLAVPLHPTQLYSSAFALLLFFMLLVLKRRWKRFDGQVFFSFLILYSAGRFLLEFLRNDNRGMFFGGALSSSQIVALVVVATSLVFLIGLGQRARRLPPDTGGSET